MTPADFDFMAKLLYDRSGLVIGKDKVYLLESRLVPLARKRGLKSLDELIAKVRDKKEPALTGDVVEAMTTNESFFFRDSKPFVTFEKETLPAMLKAREAKKALRIWSAACSTGQEPYSLAMILKEQAAKMAGWKVDIIGTDLSNEVLEKAKAGVYSQFEVQRGLPIQYLMKYFTKTNDVWQIKSDVRAMVQYRPLNLLESLAALAPMDVVFCRNVLIYFDHATKAKVLEQIGRIMTPDGVLFLGGAETVVGVSNKFKPVPGQRGVYANAA
jgi:chemotaxis protein methyltransferase CheR